MGNIACIHIKKTANPIQIQHNARDLPPDYVLSISAWAHKDGVELSCTIEQAQRRKSVIIDKANTEFEKRRKRGPHFKQPQGWSAVINLKPNHTLKDVEMVACKLEETYQWQVIMCARHYDEGHFDDEGHPVINHHGHIEFLPIDKETGKCVFRDKQRQRQWVRDLQTNVAKWLEMDRGIDKRESKRKRIEPRAWAVMKEEERAKRLTEEQALERATNIARHTNEPLEQARARVTKLYHRGFFEKMIDKGKDLVKDLTDVKKAQNEKKLANDAKDKLENENDELRQSLQQATEKNEKLEKDLDAEITETTKKFQLEPYTFTDRQERMHANLTGLYVSALKVEKPTPQDIKAFTNEIRRLLRLRKAPAICHAANEQIAKWLSSEIYTLDEVIPVIGAILSNEFELNAELERIQKEVIDKETKITQTQETLRKEIEKQIKKRYEKALEIKEQELRQEYETNLETQRLKDLNDLCALVGVPSKDTAQESKESLENGIRQLKSDKGSFEKAKTNLEKDLKELCDLAGGGKCFLASTAKTKLEEKIKEFQEQIDKIQELTTKAESAETRASNVEKDKLGLKTAINTAYSALIETQEQDNNLTVQDKLKAIETGFQLEKNKNEILDILKKDLNALCESLGISVDQNSTPQDTLKKLTEAIGNKEHVQTDTKGLTEQNQKINNPKAQHTKDLEAKDKEVQTLKEQINTLNTPQKQEAKTQDSGATTIKQKAKDFFENYSKEHKGESLHGFVCKEWVFWMDDANGKKLKARLNKVTDNELIQRLKALSFDNLETANGNFNGLLHNFGCSVQSIVCMPRSCLPKFTELTFSLYDALTPKAPEIELEQFTVQTMLESGLEKETLTLIAELGKIDPTKATEMAIEYANITDDYASRLDEFNGFLKDELLKSQQKGTQKSGGKHKWFCLVRCTFCLS
ncbi:hypothetical protein NHP190002_06470 [Helicobacter ailurogastricus]|uniref:hypothetical protein n=1 Tax=Helicobacter ailurogastricus TaxID=1578720 RepID=UPI00244D7FC3|nr:hypothetical protein [Helicobacter ailurogastricus]GMB89966.1 hypothetical protein NHP190002_06470 [Helicobacter ailurogastricus]